ncbi:GNAT family N-acetyltransferase [uncultured Shewanella sp.]|uniref:GNAT family N-acetyltransferase n=1 Tax=uncultured Shewanella sp. TaxID=173975 RepID=UPI0026042400|nr:GNAT family N-acetyltransferase [uncultured Shewanella sp.]
MLISGYGIELHPISEDNIELLRQWRNSEFVQQFMQQTVRITPEMQKKWFNSLDKDRNHYFLIKEGDTFIGCCNIKNITDEHVGEGGVFLCEEKYLNGISASKAIFLMYEWAFNSGIIIGAKSEILSNNRRAIRFNKMLGFTVEKHDLVSYGYLNKDRFFEQLTKFSSVLNSREQ